MPPSAEAAGAAHLPCAAGDRWLPKPLDRAHAISHRLTNPATSPPHRRWRTNRPARHRPARPHTATAEPPPYAQSSSTSAADRRHAAAPKPPNNPAVRTAASLRSCPLASSTVSGHRQDRRTGRNQAAKSHLRAPNHLPSPPHDVAGPAAPCPAAELSRRHLVSAPKRLSGSSAGPVTVFIREISHGQLPVGAGTCTVRRPQSWCCVPRRVCSRSESGPLPNSSRAVGAPPTTVWSTVRSWPKTRVEIRDGGLTCAASGLCGDHASAAEAPRPASCVPQEGGSLDRAAAASCVA